MSPAPSLPFEFDYQSFQPHIEEPEPNQLFGWLHIKEILVRKMLQFAVVVGLSTLTLSLSGCGEDSNTVEMPTNPTTSPGRPGTAATPAVDAEGNEMAPADGQGVQSAPTVTP